MIKGITIKLIFAILFVLYVLQLFTLNFIGKKMLIDTVYANGGDFISGKPFKLMFVYCNCQEKIIYNDSVMVELPDFYKIYFENTSPLSLDETEKIISVYEEKFDTIKIVKSIAQLERLHEDPLNMEYKLCFDFKYGFLAHVPEEIFMVDKAHDDSLVKARSTVYVWVLFKWIKVQSFGGGIS